MESLQEATKQETEFFKGEISKELVKKLPFSINVLGALFVAEYPWEGKSGITALVTFREILEWLVEKTSLDAILIKNRLKRTLNWLLKKGLIAALTAEEAASERIYIPKKARKAYGLSAAGEELLRFIPPYMHFGNFSDEIIVPVSFNKANQTLRLVLGRKESLSLSRMKKICIVRRFGKTTVVLRRLNPETAYKIFPELPYIGIKEFIEYLKAVDIPLTDEIMQVLEQAFGENEKVEWKEIAYAFQNHQKGGK